MITRSLFHWAVSATDSATAVNRTEELGFVSDSDQSRRRFFAFLPASTVIERIRLCTLPKESVFGLETVEPRSVIQPRRATHTLTVDVDDIRTAMTNTAQSIGMVIEKKHRQMPVLGSVLMGAAYVEEKICPVAFCCFTNKDTNA